jgi:hypothetical protein
MATKTHRVVCADYTSNAMIEGQARRWLAMIETTGRCRNLHTIEVRTADGGWEPEYIARARTIANTPAGSTIDTGSTVDESLTVHGGGWSKETTDRADAAAAERGSDEWMAALGPREHTILTADGGPADVSDWCACNPEAGIWVRYERWTLAGRAGHGYVDRNCRRIRHPRPPQTG